MVEVEGVCGGEVLERGEEVGAGGPGGGLEGAFGDGLGIAGELYGGWVGGGLYCGSDGGLSDVVERESGAVRGALRAVLVQHGVKVAGCHASFENEVFVRERDTVAVIEDCQGSVAALFEGRGDPDVFGAGVAGVTQELKEGVLHTGDARGAPAGSFGAGKAGESGA